MLQDSSRRAGSKRMSWMQWSLPPSPPVAVPSSGFLDHAFGGMAKALTEFDTPISFPLGVILGLLGVTSES